MAKVLVIETDSVFSAVLEDRLRVAGHQVRLLADASQASRAAREQQADLVILDTGSKPDLGALNEIRSQAESRSLPLIMLSDHAETGDRVAALRAGADDFLARPFDLEELLIRAERLLGGRGAEQMLQGDLATHPLWAVLQYLQQVHKTGSLRVRSGNTSGAVELRDGQPAAARWQTLRGREAFLALVCAEDGSFRFEGGDLGALGGLGSPSSGAEALPVNELLMHAAWLKDEMEQRRNFLPGTAEPLQTLTDFLPTVGEDFGSLPLQSVLARIHRQPGIRLFDLIADETEAPLSTRLALAWLVEHELVSTRQTISESAPQNTMEISSAMVFDVAVASLLESAKSAGFDTAALPCLVLVEPSAWPVLRQLIEGAPGFRTNDALRRLVEQVELRRGGSAGFAGPSGKLSLHVQMLTKAAQPQINAILSECAGVLAWIAGPEGTEAAESVVQKMNATGGRGSGMLVAGTPSVQKEAERLITGSRRWRSTPHAPQSLLGLFRLLQPH
ncbi:MAG TPA: response regulator [Thermoanaerobaculia bacterium]|nr:response regulator [Thermoanaerobaculia bacterium]